MPTNFNTQLAALGAALALALAGSAAAQGACAPPSLASFGVAAAPITGERPLLIVLVDLPGAPVTPDRDAAYFDRLVFGIGGAPANASAMFAAASNGAFRYTRAGLVRVSYPAPETSVRNIEAYDGFITQQTAAAFPLHSYDRNGDRVIDNSELAVIRIANSPPARGSGQTRFHSQVFRSGGAGYTFSGRTSNIDQEMDANGIAHELYHGLGFPDHIYGPGGALNARASFFAANFQAATTPGPIGLDPYDRMRAGWARPRFVEMSTSAHARVAIYGQGADREPVLFYDRTRCASEFFLAEFRNPTHALGPMDAGMFRPGFLIWYVRPDANGAPVAFNWPPPIRGPYSASPPGTHAIANYLAGPLGPGTASNLRYDMPEWSPVWGDGADTGFVLDTFFTDADASGFIGWRRAGQPLLARIDRVNGAVRASLPAGSVAPITIEGMFPIKQRNTYLRLVNLSGFQPLLIESYSPTRIVARPRAPVPAGTYQVHLYGPASHAILTRGRQLVTFN